MPYQNRVTPFGEIIATSARGLLTGNRGCLHDKQQRIRRPYQTVRWIICLLDFKGIRRRIMTPGLWTELFFLDEATALAAGHRPCAYCQRDRFNLFRELWTQANPERVGQGLPSAPQIDAVLHRERITDKGEKMTYAEQVGRLPTGAFVTETVGGSAYVVVNGVLWRWQPEGYTSPKPWPAESVVQVLTPQSVVKLLAQGYPVGLHPSVQK
ncbi:MAG: hypothetical protein U0350_15325 [Caldilineaceae bacterium]